MRTLQNANKDSDGIVEEFIGTAYDDVKLVADNLDNIQAIVDAINNLDPDSFATAAQGITADSALQPEDVDSLGKLNALMPAATLIDTTDSRLSDTRDPNAHTHVSVDVTDLADYLLETDIDSLAKINAVITNATLIDTADSRLSDDRTPVAHGHDFSELTLVPTTIAGYGITDAYTMAEVDGLTYAYGDLTGLPTTLAGYGITDAAPSSHVGGNIHIDWSVTGVQDVHPDRYTNTDTVYTHPATHPFSMLTGLPSTLGGYGIADNVSVLTNDAGYMIPADINSLVELNAIVADATLGDSADFATAAQGALADSAIQPGVLTHDGFADFVPDEHLPSSTFATAAQGTLADTALQSFDVNHDLLDGYVADEHLPSATFATAAQGTLADSAVQPGEHTHDGFADYVADEHLPSATFATAAQGTLADSALQSIVPDSISMNMLVDIPTDTYLGRTTAATGTIEVLTNANLKTALDLAGTNSGDQTDIVGISSTKAEFDVALSNGNFAYATGAYHNSFSDYVADEHLPSSTFATAAQGTLADSALQVISPDSITLDMMADVATDVILGRSTALTGTVEALSSATAKTLLDLTGTNSGDQTSIVGIGGTKAQFNTELSDGNFVYVNDLLHDTFSDYVPDEHLPSSTFATAAQGALADSALQLINADYVTMDMLVDVATDTFLGRTTALTGTVEVLTNAAAKTALDLVGSNTGDQTSIVGITGTKVQFDTAVTNGDFVYVGDLTHDGFGDYVADEHLPSSSFATAAQGALADSALQTLSSDFVTMDMLVDIPTNSFLGRVSALTGTVETLSNAAVKTALNLAGNNTGDQTSIVGITGTKAQFNTAVSDGNPVYVGDLLHDTFSDYVPDEHLPSSTFATAAQGTLADSALQTIASDSITFDMLEDVATDVFLGRITALSGTVEELTNAQAKTALDLTGVNSGDQTSIVGITGTSAQFNTANTDANFAFAGGAFHNSFSDYVADRHLPSSTFATAAQGALAATATQPADNISTLTNDSLFLAAADIDTLAELNLIIGDANLGDEGDFATAAQGTTADTASQPGHTHLEVDITDLQVYLRAADINLLAELNAILTDATLIDTADTRLSNARTPTAHTHSEVDITDLQSYLATTDINTLVKINAVIADATLIDTADSRLSDDRDPTAHTHTESEISDFGTYVTAASINTLGGLNAIVLDATLGDASDFATAAQGTLAGTAIQPADIGTAAAEDVGYFATAAQGTLADSALQSIAADSVTLDMLTDIATDTFLGRTTAVTGTVEVLTNAVAKAALDLTGINSGDQTDVTGISSTSAEFDAANSDADFAYAAGAYHDGFSDYVADEHLPSSTFATAAQGALADTALQDAGAWATDAQGTLADSAIQPADIVGRMLLKGDYNASTNTPDLDVTPIAAVKGDAYRVSVAGSFFGTVDLEAGDIIVALQNTPTSYLHWAVTNKNIKTTDFATAAQGILADSALQAADISTLAELNALIVETLIDDADPRLDPDEGTAVLSTGESAGRILTAVGDTSSVWAVPAAVEGSDLAATSQLVGKVITADGANGITWEYPTLYTSTLTTLGDLEGFDGAARGRLPVGTDGYYLAADSGETYGLMWIAPPTMSTAGMTGLYVATGTLLVKNQDIYTISGLAHTLPATPLAGWKCTVRDYSRTAESNNITIQRNGATINGAAADFVMDENGQVVAFLCSVDGNWITSSLSDIPANPAADVKVIQAATYTVLEADNGYRLLFDYATAIDVTLPDGLSITHNFIATQVGVGIPTITPGTDTINGAGTAIAPAEQWGSLKLVQYAAAEWLVEYTKVGSYLSLP